LTYNGERAALLFDSDFLFFFFSSLLASPSSTRETRGGEAARSKEEEEEEEEKVIYPSPLAHNDARNVLRVSRLPARTQRDIQANINLVARAALFSLNVEIRRDCPEIFRRADHRGSSRVRAL